MKIMSVLLALNAFFAGLNLSNEQYSWTTYLSIAAMLFCLYVMWKEDDN